MSSAASDRSVPRAAVGAGGTSHDRRGRLRSAPPILHYGFRPFFFLAPLDAGLAVPLWLLAYYGFIDIAGPFGAMQWHAHEMLFGYLAAVIAGFALTAVPNWTGRLPLSGFPLAVLVALWLAGRVACLFVPDVRYAMVVDLAFPAVLAGAIWREVVAGRNWKNTPVAIMITLFGAANGIDHLANAGLLPHDLGQKLALAVVAVLIALIGGRIVPSFTRNWLVKAGAGQLPRPFGAVDKVALVMTAASAAAWVGFPQTTLAGVLLLMAGSLLLVRLSRWRGAATVAEPIVLILHVGYAWLSIALLLLGWGTLTPAIPLSSAVHALTAGAIGTMTLAVMTRASLGHTGRAIVADRWTVAVYLLVTAGAVLRVGASLFDQWGAYLLAAGGSLWSGAFLLFAIRYAPILWGKRVNG